MRPKFRRWFDETAARHLVERIERHATVLPDADPPAAVTRDPADDYLVALARVAGAAAIVSGDRDLLDAELADPRRGRPEPAPIGSPRLLDGCLSPPDLVADATWSDAVHVMHQQSRFLLTAFDRFRRRTRNRRVLDSPRGTGVASAQRAEGRTMGEMTTRMRELKARFAKRRTERRAAAGERSLKRKAVKAQRLRHERLDDKPPR